METIKNNHINAFPIFRIVGVGSSNLLGSTKAEITAVKTAVIFRFVKLLAQNKLFHSIWASSDFPLPLVIFYFFSMAARPFRYRPLAICRSPFASESFIIPPLLMTTERMGQSVAAVSIMR